MRSFLTRHHPEVKGVLSGFDRVRFRGTIRWLSSLHGMGSFMGTMRVLLKHFKTWATGLTAQLKHGAEQTAEAAGRPVLYVASSQERKEDLARTIAARDGITEGLICVLTCVEPCHTFSVGPNRARKRLELRKGPAKCLHQYFYLLHPEWGLMHLRMQTWLPMTIHICLNGREWLSRQLRRAGIAFEQRGNCFVDVADMAAAQHLLDQQLRTDWTGAFNRLLRELQPAQAALFGERPLEYYWSADETEWATDVLFRSPADLASIYPGLLQHAITNFHSPDVLRFLGRRGSVKQLKTAEVQSSYKTREEGTRVKHSLNRNSVKMYDKQGSVLRVETTINDARDMKAYRPKEGDPNGPKTWQRLRKGVADLHRRAQISGQSNERYLEALAAVEHEQALGETVEALCRPTLWKGRRVRALKPLNPDDNRLLAAVAHGEFVINGFRNRDLHALLFETDDASPDESKRQTGKVTRQLRLLRAHGLIRKISKTHRYQLTPRGRLTITAILAAQNASTQRLTQLAA